MENAYPDKGQGGGRKGEEMKPIVLKKWTEVDDQMLGPDKKSWGWEAFVFCTGIEKHRGPKSGKITLNKNRFIFTAEGKTKTECLDRIAKFIKDNKAKIVK